MGTELTHNPLYTLADTDTLTPAILNALSAGNVQIEDDSIQTIDLSEAVYSVGKFTPTIAPFDDDEISYDINEGTYVRFGPLVITFGQIHLSSLDSSSYDPADPAEIHGLPFTANGRGLNQQGETSATSGFKTGVNGAIFLSIPDGANYAEIMSRSGNNSANVSATHLQSDTQLSFSTVYCI